MRDFSNDWNRLLCHCAVNAKGIAYVVITDGEYPQRTAYGFGHKTLEMIEKEYGDKLFSSSIKEDQTNNVRHFFFFMDLRTVINCIYLKR